MAKAPRINQGKTKGNGVGGNGNLIPQKAGEPSRNPAGRPPLEKCFSSIAREMLSANSLDITFTFTDKNGKPREKKLFLKSDKNLYHGMIAAMIQESIAGNVLAFKELSNRVDGIPRQALDLSNNGDKFTAPPQFVIADKKTQELIERLFSESKNISLD